MRLALILAIGLMAAGAALSFLGKNVVVMAYGEGYRDSAHVLPAMMLAGVPWAISSLLLTEARVLHRNVTTVVITVTLTLSIIVPALLLVPGDGPHRGLNGASAAWLLGNVAAAVIAIVATAVSRRQAAGRGVVRVGPDPLAPAT
jgi:O-antigen/teichoic acid export membrane protein